MLKSVPTFNGKPFTKNIETKLYDFYKSLLQNKDSGNERRKQLIAIITVYQTTLAIFCHQLDSSIYPVYKNSRHVYIYSSLMMEKLKAKGIRNQITDPRKNNI